MQRILTRPGTLLVLAMWPLSVACASLAGLEDGSKPDAERGDAAFDSSNVLSPDGATDSGPADEAPESPDVSGSADSWGSYESGSNEAGSTDGGGSGSDG